MGLIGGDRDLAEALHLTFEMVTRINGKMR